ncbi:MAG: bifunctional sulfate adenylyltransferase/adenylylsulfate kinase [Hyphomicrobiales bacterium]|nr:bifunctional sulfate adenylyltransferase/adenylylsulfate kinase [Hyphomicrobiales bacterium]
MIDIARENSRWAPTPELFAVQDDIPQLKADAGSLPSWDLTARQLCDLELLMNGGFAPLQGFLGKDDYENVLDNLRLLSGDVWPIPVTLDVSEEFAGKIGEGQRIALRDPENLVLAILEVQSIWQPDKTREAEKVFGANDPAHPAVRYLHDKAGTHYIGGRVIGLQAPIHYDFRERRHTPNELKAQFQKWGWTDVVAFQTRNPLHRAHLELTLRATEQVGANLLIHPVVGMTKPGDVDHYTRVRCYEALLPHYPDGKATLDLLPLAMRMAGPREALWHALIRRNYGCTHFIVGRDHAGPGKNSAGEPFYGPYDAQELVTAYKDEIGIQMVPFREMVYLQNRKQYAPADEIQPGEAILNLSGTELRRRLQTGEDIPEWFSFPSVIQELRKTHPPRDRQGFTVFFTGLSGAGKSTIANALMAKLMQAGGRQLTLLDGDIVRKHLSSELGFSKEHRNINILRIGYVASEITKNGGIAICAPIAPYAATRREVREMIEPYGAFIEVHVATPLDECERRDRKGLYKLAREGKIKQFTGIDDPYEAPETPEVTINTLELSPSAATDLVIAKLIELGLLPKDGAGEQSIAEKIA